MTIEVRCKRVGPIPTPLPRRAHEGDAGLDLCAAVRPNMDIRGLYELHTSRVTFRGRALIPTGWAFEIPPGYVGLVQPRSGMSKRGIFAVTGVLDSGYRGEVSVQLEAGESDEEWVTINHGDRIAQLVIVPIPAVSLIEVDELGPSERGARGFGSSGVSAMGEGGEAK